MDKEQLIKLAVVAGYKVDYFGSGKIAHFTHPSTGQIHTFDAWQPHKDISQAFEVLEGCGLPYELRKGKFYSINPPKKFSCVLYTKGERALSSLYETLPEAICKAVLKATEQG